MLVGAVGTTVVVQAPNLEVGGSNLSLCISLVSLGKALYLRLSLSTQEYKWVPGWFERKCADYSRNIMEFSGSWVCVLYCVFDPIAGVIMWSA